MLWVDNTGQTRTWINQRGVSQSLRPFWLSAGVTHVGRGYDIGRDNIQFGRLYSDRHTDVSLETDARHGEGQKH